MASIYERQRLYKLFFLLCCGAVVVIFLVVSNGLVKELAQQERERVAIWAKATEKLARADAESDFEFLLAIIQQNNTIPVLVADDRLQIIEFRNFDLPDKSDLGKFAFDDLSERNRLYLSDRLTKAGPPKPGNPHFIQVEIGPDAWQYIYYEDSVLLRRLNFYPYIELGVMLALGLIVYFAARYAKRAEQDRLWAGLSKETAHQLGTPISSLMAWNQYLEATGTDPEVTTEIEKDVDRLSMIADRFSKIGSRPELQPYPLKEVINRSIGYMKKRVSGKVALSADFQIPDDSKALLSPPLFSWVMENLLKNAVDAMEGMGSLRVTVTQTDDRYYVDITDSGRGIPRKNFKTVFSPGFTTKPRGWGLGLTFAKRIIESYHNGRIFVKDSVPGHGTTFRIELPRRKSRVTKVSETALISNT